MRIFRYLSIVFLLLLLVGYVRPALDAPEQDVSFSERVVISGLSDPWEIVMGPDNYVWATEAKAYRVIRVHVASGNKQVVLDLSGARQFKKGENLPWPQGGLMGMALHPEMGSGTPYVYLAYAYKHLQGNRFLVRLARYQYNSRSQMLEQGQTICDSIPASNDHNGGRLAIAREKGLPYLFYSVGDMGSGQFKNGGAPNYAQNVSSYEGKILRYHLEPSAQSSGEDAWIPSDNPFNGQRRSAVWTVGHRNPQGLAAANIEGTDMLYASEHGPYSDDEINLIQRGANYGHPLVIGYADGNYSGLAASVSSNQDYPGPWHTSYPLIGTEQDNARKIGSSYRDPVKSFYPVPADTLKPLFKKINSGGKSDWLAWAPAGIEVYDKDVIPGWKRSLLIATLKGGTLLRLKLNDEGKIAGQQVFEYQKGRQRYRDVTVSAAGEKIYLATDSASVTSGPSAENPKSVACRGCIIELTYQSR
ncbi:PQQ-dependent sugar dehydrogenase [Pedobacter deserti]|uniref:PQQ-dependent sugar dehydrogenase n=1 Tax=Pedobacter deserti TaxID=2817382 RepID=UPI00210DF839|nr:PQQ-dependent sugar dehydrogenase [Pedobacter sp. SYSU D00382]